MNTEKELLELMDKLEDERILYDGDSNEEYLDIPLADWEKLRILVNSLM